MDLVIELIGGLDPARRLVGDALELGKPVVTANKELIANHGRDLFQAAQSTGFPLLYEGSVCAGIPIVRTARHALTGDRVTQFAGVLNGTTNFILSKMQSHGWSVVEALAEARRLGYAERNPRADVSGYDPACKAAIMASLLFRTSVTVDRVAYSGIENLSQSDVAAAGRIGYVIKLLARGQRHGERVEASVDVVALPPDHPLAGLKGPTNGVVIETELAGTLSFTGPGAGGDATAAAVIADIAEVIRSPRAAGGHDLRNPLEVAQARGSPGRYLVALATDQNANLGPELRKDLFAHGIEVERLERFDWNGSVASVLVTDFAESGCLSRVLSSFTDRGLLRFSLIKALQT